MRPNLGSMAEELYARLEPFHSWHYEDKEVTDEELGWPLFIYWGLLVKVGWQEIDDLSRDSDAGSGWSTIVDLERIPDKGLPYISQYTGVELPQTVTPAEARELIASPEGHRRGTPTAMRSAGLRTLTGAAPTLILNEHVGGNAYRVGAVTFLAETPDPVATFTAMSLQKPWWILLTHEVVDAFGYTVIQLAFDDYGQVQAHYPDYEGLQTNTPPAPL
jgi:hypothetical protein